MHIFISWSGERSKQVAEALRDWLPTVIQAVKPWMSKRDIEKGASSVSKIHGSLESADFGVFCLTRDNRASTWITFEAGAIAGRRGATCVGTYLLDLNYTDVEGPLAQFQHTVANSQDTWQLLETVNRHLTQPLPQEILKEIFEVQWPKLEAKLDAARQFEVAKPPIREQAEKIDEILTIVRGLQWDQIAGKISQSVYPEAELLATVSGTKCNVECFLNAIRTFGVHEQVVGDEESQIRHQIDVINAIQGLASNHCVEITFEHDDGLLGLL